MLDGREGVPSGAFLSFRAKKLRCSGSDVDATGILARYQGSTSTDKCTLFVVVCETAFEKFKRVEVETLRCESRNSFDL